MLNIYWTLLLTVVKRVMSESSVFGHVGIEICKTISVIWTLFSIIVLVCFIGIIRKVGIFLYNAPSFSFVCSLFSFWKSRWVIRLLYGVWCCLMCVLPYSYLQQVCDQFINARRCLAICSNSIKWQVNWLIYLLRHMGQNSHMYWSIHTILSNTLASRVKNSLVSAHVTKTSETEIMSKWQEWFSIKFHTKIAMCQI